MAMNERSSQSHTIFRITVESRLKDTKKHMTMARKVMRKEIWCTGNDAGNSSGAVRVSTLNLVDLAVSESVRHTGSTGDRQKEGDFLSQCLQMKMIHWILTENECSLQYHTVASLSCS